MSVTAVTLLFALLTVIAQVAVVALGVAQAGSRWEPARRLRALAAPHGLGLAALVAVVATLGSLYLSEVAHFRPCALCWFQRSAMYPLAVLLVLAVWRRDLAVRPYALALALLGAPISAWHYLVQRFPQLESGSCDPDNPCSLVWVWRFGYLSIPLMAGTAFVLIVLLMTVAGDAEGEVVEGEDSQGEDSEKEVGEGDDGGAGRPGLESASDTASP